MGLEPLGSFSGADTVKALALGVEFLRLIKPKDHWTYDYEIPAMKKILVACVQARRYINDHRKDGELLKVHEELRRIEKGTDKRADT
jgi:hypothetical protein